MADPLEQLDDISFDEEIPVEETPTVNFRGVNPKDGVDSKDPLSLLDDLGFDDLFPEIPEVGKVETFARGAAETATLGFANDIVASLQAALGEAGEFFGLTEAQDYLSRVEEARKVQETRELAGQEQNPLTAMAGELVGFFTPGAGSFLVKGGTKLAGKVTAKASQTALRIGDKASNSLVRNFLGAASQSRVAGAAVEGAASGAAFAAGREAAEAIRGEEGASLSDVTSEAATGAGFSAAITGAVVGVPKAARVGVQLAKGVLYPAKRIARKFLPKDVVAILDNPRSAAGFKGNPKDVLEENADKLLNIVDDMKTKLTDEVSLLQSNLDDQAQLVAAQVDDTLTEIGESIADKVAVQQADLTDEVVGLATSVRGIRKSLNVSYGTQVDEIFAAADDAGVKLDVSSAVDDLKRSLLNDGLAAINKKGKFVANHKAVNKDIAKFINELDLPNDGISGQQANELKKLMATFARFDDGADEAERLFRDTYFKLRDQLVAELPNGKAFDKLSASYTQTRRIGDALQRAVRDVEAGDIVADSASLLKKLESDISTVVRSKGGISIGQTKTAGRLKGLVDQTQFQIFTPDEQKLVNHVIKNVGKNYNIKKLADPRKIRSELKRVIGKKGTLEGAGNLKKAQELIGKIDELKQIDELVAGQNLPQVLRNATKSPKDKELFKRAEDFIRKTMPDNLAEFKKLHAKSNRLNRLAKLPSRESKIIKEVAEKGILNPQELRSLGFAMDLIPEVNKLVESTKLAKTLSKAYNPKALVLSGFEAAAGVFNPGLFSVFVVSRALKNTVTTAILLEKAGIVTKKADAKTMALAISNKFRNIQAALAVGSQNAGQ